MDEFPTFVRQDGARELFAAPDVFGVEGFNEATTRLHLHSDSQELGVYVRKLSETKESRLTVNKSVTTEPFRRH